MVGMGRGLGTGRGGRRVAENHPSPERTRLTPTAPLPRSSRNRCGKGPALPARALLAVIRTRAHGAKIVDRCLHVDVDNGPLSCCAGGHGWPATGKVLGMSGGAMLLLDVCEWSPR